MPDLNLSRGVRRRELGSPRRYDLFNMFLEIDPDAPDGFSRQSRTGLVEAETIGTGPVLGMLMKDGVLGGARFAVSGSSVYEDATSLGLIEGSGPVSMAASATEMVVTRGAKAKSYNGTDFAEIAFPDAANVTAVAYLAGYFVFLREDSHSFWWSASGDARTIDALDFASAESAADPLRDVYVVNDGLWLMGSETVEFWQFTGNADAPFARVEGVLLKKGLKATGAADELDNTLFWWGHDNAIYRAGQGAPQRVSDDAIDEALEASATQSVFGFTYKGHALLVVLTDRGTFVFDVATGSWGEWGTHGRTGWRISCAVGVGDTLQLGDDTNGTLWTFDDNDWTDGSILERRLTASFPAGVGSVVVDRLCIEGNPGTTPDPDAEPVVEMRASLDNGRTWGAYRSASLGVQGRYRQRIEKRAWGLFSDKGGMFEVRVTDAAPFRVARIYANEPSEGRSTK